MIKRNYFMSVKKPHDDGNGSYSYHYAHFYRKGWFDESEAVFAEALDQFEKELGHKPGEGLEVVAFNRC